jgi:hypothetical protein
MPTENRSSTELPEKPELVECDSCPRSGGCVSTCMKAPASAEPSAKQAFRDYCDRCAEIVAPWPVWKRQAIKSPPVPAVVCRPGINCGKCYGCTNRAPGKQP